LFEDVQLDLYVDGAHQDSVWLSDGMLFGSPDGDG